MNTLTVNIPVPAIVHKGVTWLIGSQPTVEAPAPATRRRQYRQRRTIVGQLVEERGGLTGVVIARSGQGVDATYTVSVAYWGWSQRRNAFAWLPTGRTVYRRRHELQVVR